MKTKICSLTILFCSALLAWHPSMAATAGSTAVPVNVRNVAAASSLPTNGAADVSPCHVESIYFAQCLHDHAQSMVRQDPTKPPAESAYAIRLDDAQGHQWATTVLMPRANTVPVAGTLGDLHFALNTLLVDGAAMTIAFHADGAGDGSDPFIRGDEHTVHLIDGRTITITRL